MPLTPPRPITSAANETVKRLRALDARKHRARTGLFIAEGRRHIAAALDKGWLPETLVLRADAVAENADLVAAAQKHGIDCAQVPAAVMARLGGRDNPQAVIAAFPQRWHERPKGGLWVALEGIRDPGNLGAIIRTAAAVGGDGIMLLGETCDPYAPEAVRASMGGLVHVALARMTVADFPSWRSAWPGQVTGTAMTAATDYRQGVYGEPLILLMGNETTGLSPALLAACDQKVAIPMTPAMESLNIAIATALMLYQVRGPALDLHASKPRRL
ncbi:MAG: TrmH family RNA methyltransferase [Pseudomonadota bacterium]